jgi:hypothetical protein
VSSAFTVVTIANQSVLAGSVTLDITKIRKTNAHHVARTVKFAHPIKTVHHAFQVMIPSTETASRESKIVM